jgi:positive regulator of sigma E activity
MDQTREILHEGIVQTSDNNSVTIMISSSVSCEGCLAEKSCNHFGNGKKSVRVPGHYNIKNGEKVIVTLKESLGYTALFLGYLLPLFLVLISLIVLISFSVSELISGLISIAILAPYYLTLFLFRKYINRRFSFTLKPVDTNE